MKFFIQAVIGFVLGVLLVALATAALPFLSIGVGVLLLVLFGVASVEKLARW